MTRVLDAFAMLAWLQDESGASYVESLLRSAAAGEARLYISSINLGEVYYRLAKAGATSAADQLMSRVQTGELPVERISATNTRVDAAAKLKSLYPISYADAFAVSLSLEEDAPLLTDDPEILHLAGLGIVRVDRVRP